MRNLLKALFANKSRTIRKLPTRKLELERLEDRLAPAGNILVSTNGPGLQQLLQEYTPGGTLVQAVEIPPAGAWEDARDLVADAAGNILVYNGTFDPYLSTYAAGAWNHQTYSGWSTVNNVSYGGIGLFGNYAFVTDMWTRKWSCQMTCAKLALRRGGKFSTCRFARNTGKLKTRRHENSD